MRALEDGSGAFAHGHTFQAHPVACAAALEVQRIIAEEHLVENVQRMGAVLTERLRARFDAHPHVADIRGRGLFQALEFVEDRATLAPFEATRQFAARVKRTAPQHGRAGGPGAGALPGRRGGPAPQRRPTPPPF